MDKKNNTGNENSGNWNSGDRNSGSFNTNEPKMRLFNKELDITVSDFYKKYDISMNIQLNEWVSKSDMTEEEKANNPFYETTGGYLKTMDYKDACRKWWEDNPNDHERFLTLPGFDSEIFKEITGIDTEKKEAMIELPDGRKFSASTILEALKRYVDGE